MDDLGRHPSTFINDTQFDRFQISSNEENTVLNVTINSQIINIIIPEALTTVMPLRAGEIAGLCLGKKSKSTHIEANFDDC